MTKLEEMALELWRPGAAAEVNMHNFSILGSAFLEMRERHEAYKQAVSDAIDSSVLTPETEAHLSRFIIAKPDPLVEALLETFPRANGAEGMAADLRAAIEARGGRIVWEGE